MKQQQSGFTLIELVAVIVLLGILAITALPRFVNLQTDARLAALDGVSGAMQGAAAQIYAKSLIQGTENGAGTVDLDPSAGSDLVETSNGYPVANQAVLATNKSILQIIGDVSSLQSNPTAAATSLRIGYNISDVVGTRCYIVYTNSVGNGAPPAITKDATTTDGC